jgi:hypothetical protein
MKLKNPTKRLVEVNLDHPDFMRVVETPSVVHNPRTGGTATQYKQRRVFPSVMFLAGEVKTLPDTAINAPSVSTAIARGFLKKL